MVVTSEAQTADVYWLQHQMAETSSPMKVSLQMRKKYGSVSESLLEGNPCCGTQKLCINHPSQSRK